MTFIVIILTTMLIGILSDIYIYRLFIRNKILKIVFLIKSFILQFSIIGAAVIFGTGSELLSHNHLLWLFIIYFLIYIPQSIFSLISPFDYFVRLKIKTSCFFSRLGAVVSLLIMLLIIYGISYGRSVARIERTEILSSRLPETFNGYKIVQLSDIHIGNFGSNTKIIENIIDKVNSLNPDAIMMTGDLVNLKADELTPFIKILSSLKAKDGVFSVLGNHDYGDYVRWTTKEEKENNLKDLIETQSSMGWQMLNNNHHIIRSGSDSIAIIGVENWGIPPFKKNGDLTKAYPTLNDDIFKILLSHNPTHWEAEVLSQTNIDVTLSGHTHAMQMKLTIFGKSYSFASRMYKHWSGLYNKGEKHLYVNDGIGYVGIPFRIGTRPEITEITIKTNR